MKTNRESFFLSSEAWSTRKYLLASGYLHHFRAKNPHDKHFYCVDTFDSTSSGGIRTVGVRRPLSSAANAGVKLIKVATKKIIDGPANAVGELTTGAVATMNGKLEEVFPRILSIIGNQPALFFIDPSGSPSLSF